MKENTPLEVGDIVQLSPEAGNPAFSGCFMVVSEPKPWGAQGYVKGLEGVVKFQDHAYYRAKWEEMEHTGGKAVWMPADEEGDTNGSSSEISGAVATAAQETPVG